MTHDFTFEPGRNFIIINQQNYDKYLKYINWAKEHKDLYHVFNSGIIMYKNDAGKDWFLLKWS